MHHCGISNAGYPLFTAAPKVQPLRGVRQGSREEAGGAAARPWVGGAPKGF